MSSDDRKQAARKLELGASTGAGVVGSGFGAAKLRDAYKEDQPGNPARLHDAATRVANRVTGNPSRAARLVRVADEGKPPFKVLAAATGLAATATLARRYQGVESLRQRRHDAERNGLPTTAVQKSGDPVDNDAAFGIVAKAMRERSKQKLANAVTVGGAGVALGAHKNGSTHLDAAMRLGQAGSAAPQGSRAKSLASAGEAAHMRGFRRSAVVSAGAAGATLGAMHVHDKSVEREKAARKTRRAQTDAPLAKAFDAERNRHQRAGLEAGALAGTSVAAGAGAVRAHRAAGAAARQVPVYRGKAAQAYTAANRKLHEVHSVLGRGGDMPAPERADVTTAQHEGRSHLEAGHQLGGDADRLAARAARSGGRAKLLAAGSAAAATGAFGILHRDRKGAGRSYP